MLKDIKIKFDENEISLESLKTYFKDFNKSLTDDKILNYQNLYLFLNKLEEGSFILFYRDIDNDSDEYIGYYSKQLNMIFTPCLSRTYNKLLKNLFGSAKPSQSLDNTGQNGYLCKDQNLDLIYLPSSSNELIEIIHYDIGKPYYEYEQYLNNINDRLKKLIGKCRSIECEDDNINDYVNNHFIDNIEDYESYKLSD